MLNFVLWYGVVQLITLAALPLTGRLFGRLADRGYAFAKSLGILGVGLLFWLGYSYGLLRNGSGGAWLAWLLLAALSVRAGWPLLQAWRQGEGIPSWRYIAGVELLFLVTFAGWAWVRAQDPAANHTEQPMDLMFMNGIWASPTYPPQDPWLAGYAISYYYLGYWLVATLGQMAGQLPEVAYNLGQACWYGLLWIGAFGVGYNLVASDGDDAVQNSSWPVRAGLLSGLSVAFMGNLQGVWEWLYAQGVPIQGVASFFQVRNFPDNAVVSKLWYIGTDWWWWRSSRVIQDADLLGNHLEVIDEFPIFSYILGDNHPHVLAMPFVILAIALAWNVLLAGFRPIAPLIPAHSAEEETIWVRMASAWSRMGGLLPMGVWGLLIAGLVVGAPLSLNTWDFPPYWLLFVLCALVVWRMQGVSSNQAIATAGGMGGLLVVGAVVLYLPYFLTAQSQAGGIVPNLFHPTRLRQFFLMFGPFLVGVGGLIWLALRRLRPEGWRWSAAATLVLGFPLIFLVASGFLLLSGQPSGGLLAHVALPPGSESHLPFILQRWMAHPWTFLLLGGLLATVTALVWQQMDLPSVHESPEDVSQRLPVGMLFALLLSGVGLLLVFAPEFVYLRDNFGPAMRMNTVFKFYYQGWLLLGLGSAYGIVTALRQADPPGVAGAFALLLIGAGLFYPVAGIGAKTGVFSNPMPTLDAIDYIRQFGPDEYAAIQWVRANTAPDAVIAEAKGASYRAETSRISTATGRPTLMGWDGHESQWRGQAFSTMAAGRGEALDTIFRQGNDEELRQILEKWNVGYVYVGPQERTIYGIAPGAERRFETTLDLVFESGTVRIYQRRGLAVSLNR